MRSSLQVVGGVSFWLVAAHAPAATHYVDLNSTNPAPPYTSWAVAAITIQDAIDVASPGDTVLVNDGIYTAGGRSVGTNLSLHRVVVDKPLTLQSLNGPGATAIQGAGTAGSNAVRCVYLTSNFALLGFTLAGGATRTDGDFLKELCGGAAWCESPTVLVSNCVISSSSAYYFGGGVFGGTWNNCTFISNSASGGGGTYSAALNNCTLTGNSASHGGGGTYLSTLNGCTLLANCGYDGGAAYAAKLTNCILSQNWARNGGAAEGGTLVGCTISNNSADEGGGTYQGTLINCTISSNSAHWGGGTVQGTLYNCALIGNFADFTTLYNNGGFGGGAYYGTLNNCVLRGNIATTYSGTYYSYGGGARWATLNNCTVCDNHLGSYGYGGGVANCTLTNCLVYFNTALPGGENHTFCTFAFSCTAPDPGGSGNITNAPLLLDFGISNFRLQSNSPCINAGQNAGISTLVDADGNPRVSGGTVDIGAYEFQNPASLISYQWLQQYGLPSDGSADFADLDHDGMNNYQEWRSGTIPSDALSVLKMLLPFRAPTGISAQWLSVSGVTYFLQRATNLAVQPAFSTVKSNIIGQAGTTMYIDTNAIGNVPLFYRVGVE